MTDFQEPINEMAIQVGALMTMLVEKGICTPHEWECCVARHRAMVDQIIAEKVAEFAAGTEGQP